MVCSQLLGRQRLSGFIFTPKHSHLLGVFVVHRHALSDLNSCQAINKTVWQGGGGWGGADKAHFMLRGVKGAVEAESFGIN